MAETGQPFVVVCTCADMRTPCRRYFTCTQGTHLQLLKDHLYSTRIFQTLVLGTMFEMAITRCFLASSMECNNT